MILITKKPSSPLMYKQTCPFCKCEFMFTEDETYDIAGSIGQKTISCPNCSALMVGSTVIASAEEVEEAMSAETVENINIKSKLPPYIN